MSATLDPFLISVDGEGFPFEVDLIGTDGEFAFDLPDSEMIFDYPERTAKLLIEEFEPSEKLQALTKALTTPANELEKVFFDLKNQRSASTADGVQLDLVGELVGESRQGRDDEEYRQAILLRPLINKSFGEGEILILALEKLTNASHILLLEAFPKHVILSFKTTDDIPNNLITSIEEVADAGVKISLSYIDQGEIFAFGAEGGFPEELNTSGFGETGIGNENEGGKFAEILT